MESTKYISELHAEHGKWIEQLNFFADEISSFRKRLDELVKLNSKTEFSAQIEHFENQLIRQKEVLDILKHDIQISEQSLQSKVSINPIATDRKRMLDEPDLRDQVATFEKLFNELKLDFKQFLMKVL